MVLSAADNLKVKHKTNETLNDLHKWFSANQIHFNLKKIKVVQFHNYQKLFSDLTVENSKSRTEYLV